VPEAIGPPSIPMLSTNENHGLTACSWHTSLVIFCAVWHYFLRRVLLCDQPLWRSSRLVKLDISRLDRDSFLNTNLSKMLSSILSAAHNAVKDRKWLQTSNPNGWQDMLRRNWHLGVTSFGGPAVHFQIVRFALESYRLRKSKLNKF
jgi:hypothetical protein